MQIGQGLSKSTGKSTPLCTPGHCHVESEKGQTQIMVWLGMYTYFQHRLKHSHVNSIHFKQDELQTRVRVILYTHRLNRNPGEIFNFMLCWRWVYGLVRKIVPLKISMDLALTNVERQAWVVVPGHQYWKSQNLIKHIPFCWNSYCWKCPIFSSKNIHLLFCETWLNMSWSLVKYTQWFQAYKCWNTDLNS